MNGVNNKKVCFSDEVLLAQLNNGGSFLSGAKEFPTEDSSSSGNSGFALLWSEKQLDTVSGRQGTVMQGRLGILRVGGAGVAVNASPTYKYKKSFQLEALRASRLRPRVTQANNQ